MEIEFPIEFAVKGTPVSLQAKRAEAKTQWQAIIRDASRKELPEAHWASESGISVTIFYFPDNKMDGDIDNIIKPVLDAMSAHIYIDDSQVERIVVQKFEPGNIFPFTSPSARLEETLYGDRPILYIRISDKPFEELK